MNSFAELFEKKGIEVTDFEDKEVDSESIERELWIEFLSTYLKMCERNASEKEIYNFVTEHGFLSQKHLGLYLSLTDIADTLEDELNDLSNFYGYDENSKEYIAKIEEFIEARNRADAIKSPSYYSLILRVSKEKDISPYGVNVIDSKHSKELEDSLRGYKYQQAHKR